MLYAVSQTLLSPYPHNSINYGCNNTGTTWHPTSLQNLHGLIRPRAAHLLGMHRPHMSPIQSAGSTVSMKGSGTDNRDSSDSLGTYAQPPMAHNTPTYIMRDGATYEYGSATAGATTIQRAGSGREVSSPHGDPAGHYPGSECLTPLLPPWPTVARENYPLPDTTLMPPISSSSPRNFMRTMPMTHPPTARDRRTPSRSRTTCVHGRRGGVVTRATRGGVRSDEFRGQAGVS